MTQMPTLYAPIIPPQTQRVLVVASHSEHIGTVRGLAKGWAHASHIEWAKGLNQAVELALLIRPTLVLLDGQLNTQGARSLEQQLARWCADADLYTFFERGQPRPTATQHDQTLHWDELPMLLRAWRQRRVH
jgi:hypothetical protein